MFFDFLIYLFYVGKTASQDMLRLLNVQIFLLAAADSQQWAVVNKVMNLQVP